jgi:hypothetical protein
MNAVFYIISITGVMYTFYSKSENSSFDEKGIVDFLNV